MECRSTVTRPWWPFGRNLVEALCSAAPLSTVTEASLFSVGCSNGCGSVMCVGLEGQLPGSDRLRPAGPGRGRPALTEQVWLRFRAEGPRVSKGAGEGEQIKDAWFLSFKHPIPGPRGLQGRCAMEGCGWSYRFFGAPVPGKQQSPV